VPVPPSVAPGSPALAAAAGLTARSKFTEAEAAANKLSDGDKYSLGGNVLRARLAMSANQLQQAQALLAQARRLDPHDAEATALLGEVLALEERWMDAAPMYERGKKNGLALQAQELAAAMPYQPFRIEGLGALNRIRLIHTNPAAVVAVRVNGGDVINFAVDLNAGQTVVDGALAKQMGLKTIADIDELLADTFKPSDAKVERVTYSTIGALAMGVWVVHDLPVMERNLMSNASGAQGLIGTGVLRHFLVTLDLPHGELWLQRVDDASAAAARKQAQASAVKTVPVRFTATGALVHADGSPIEDALLREGPVTMDFQAMVLWIGK